MNHQIENTDNSQDEENQKSTQEQINNNETCIDATDDESEKIEDISKPIVYNSKKSRSPIIHLKN